MHQEKFNFGVDNTEPNLILLALTFVRGIGPIKILELIEITDGFSKNISKKLSENLGELYNNFVIELEQVQSKIQKLKSFDIKYFTILDPVYPEGLKLLSNPPSILYYKISPNWTIEQLFSLSKIAVVGSRKFTKYGENCAKNITNSLSTSDTVIVSGMASGIDSIAHNATLKINRPTIAVLASSVDLPTPRLNYSTYNSILKNGMVISEYFPSTQSIAGNFPHRNRIVAGLADAVVVIQAAVESGSLITPNIAFPLGKEIFAVPGQLGDPNQAGCNELISKNIAKIFTSSEEVLRSIGFKNVEIKSENKVRTNKFSDELTERIYVEISGTDSVAFDKILEKLKMERSELILKIMELEMSGHIKFDGTGYISL